MNPTKKSEKIGLLIVDDHPVVREGLAAIINRQPDAVVVAEAGNGQQAVEEFHRHRPDVTLMDLRLPGMSGTQAIVAIRKEHPDARFVVLTTYDGDEDIYRAIEAGAQGYLLKDMFREELMQAIRLVHRGQRYIPTAVAGRLAQRMRADDLSTRERDVLELIATGQSNKEIATALGISEPTIKGHVTSILAKLGASDRTRAVTVALQRGIIHL